MSAIARCVALIAGLFIANAAISQTTFYPMSPVRLMDTRPGGTTIDGQSAGGMAGTPLQGGGTYSLTVAGRAGIPSSGVNAVVLNITVTNPGATGFFIAWPAGTSRPTASTINYVGGQSVSGQAIVKLGSNGKVSLFVNGVTISANVIVDVAGYFPTTADYVPLTPARLLDTRAGTTTIDGLDQGTGALGTATSGGTFNLPVRNRGGVPSSGVSAVVVNITATNTTQAGFLVAWQTGATRPNPASNLNFVPGQTIANLAIVNPDSSGNISLFANRGPTDVIVDVVGYLPSTVDFSSVAPARLLDTRAGLPTVDGQFTGIGALAGHGQLDLPVLGRGGIPSIGVGAVALNVTVTNPAATTGGFITVWPTGNPSSAPTAMQVNFATAQTIQSQVIAEVGADGKVSLANISAGSTDVIVDVQGWFPSPPNDGASPIGYPTIPCSGNAPPIKSGDEPAIPGAWYDSSRPGTGWNLVYDTGNGGLSVTWFTYGAGFRPIWLLSDPAFIDIVTNQWTANLNEVTLQSDGTKVTTPVGTVAIQFIPGSATRAAIRWKWNFFPGSSPAPDECIYQYFADGSAAAATFAIPSTPTVDESYSGVWSDPRHSNWALYESIGIVPGSNSYVESETLTIYDASGTPVWLQAQQGPGSAPSTTAFPTPLTLWYYKSRYAVNTPCSGGVAACRVDIQAGSINRSFTNEATEVLTATAHLTGMQVGGTNANAVDWPSTTLLFPDSTSGTPPTYSTESNPTTLTKYVGNDYLYVSQTYCLLTGAQTNCTIYVAWNSSTPNTKLYQRDLTTGVLNSTPITPIQDGEAQVNLPAGSDVQYEVHSGTTSTGPLLLTSPEVKVSPASPSCTSESASIAILPAGATTQRILATGVQNATAVTFPTWWLPGNQADIQWIAGVNDGGGNWHADINLAQFDPTTARYGSFETDVYMSNAAYNNGSQVMCGGGTWIRSQTGVPDAPVSAATSVASMPTTTDQVSDAVGATLAQFRVDEGGNATYSIPIQVPPGTAGMTPKLALSYNSRMPGSVMGQGWAIEGASSISRCRQTRESGDFMSGATPVDGNPLPINFTTTDRFCLDGVRLLLTSSANYGDDGTTYSPETDPTIRVTAHTTTSAIGPDSFTVNRKDGSASTYGNTSASSSALVTATPSGTSTAVNVSWNLSRVQDTTGNYIDYLYLNQPATSDFSTLAFASTAVETVLSQVNYTGHISDVTPYASITFNYGPLPAANVRVGYQGGIASLQSQRLNNVTVSDSSNGTLRYYDLTYQASTSGSQSQQLKQVQECRDSTKAVCFPATVFAWSAAVNSFGTEQTSSGPDFSHLVSYKIADVDGDGRQDFVWAADDGGCPSGHSSIYVGFVDTTSGQLSLNAQNETRTCAPIDLKGNDQAWYLIDYDGDGRADLMIGGDASVGGKWQLFSSLGRPTSQGTVFSSVDSLASPSLSIPVVNHATPDGTTSNMAVGIFADLNGDGLPDFIYPTDDTTGLAVRFLTKSGSSLTFSAAYTLTYSINDANCTLAKFPYLSGCWIALFNSNSTTHRSATVADFNGDGRSDLMAEIIVTSEPQGCGTCDVPNTGPRDYWAQFSVSQITPPNGSTAGVVTLQETWFDSNFSLPSDSTKVFAVDLNGDGLADILYQDVTTDPAHPTFKALINNGSQGLQSNGQNGPGYSAPITAPGVANAAFLQIADVNGDGVVDIVYPVGTPPDDKTQQYQFTSYNYVTLTATASGWAFTSPAVVPGSGLNSSNQWVSVLGDLDGDGTPDFISVAENGGSGNVTYSRSAATSRYQPRDVITGFTNGLGASTTVAYQPLTNIGIYQRGARTAYPSLTSASYGWGSPVMDVLAPMYVVSQATSSAPVHGSASNTSTVSYRYAGATMQAGGRGFLGFAEVWAFDDNDAATTGQYVATVNRYAQRYPFIGMPIQTIREVLTGSKTSRGSTLLDACATAANLDTSGYNCFSGITGPASAPLFQTAWSDITATGIWISQGTQQPLCTGAGCNTAPASGQCAIDASLPTIPIGDPTSGAFTPAATASPVFAYLASTADTQYDLGSGSAGNPIATASSRNFFCYDGSNGSSLTASSGDLLGSLEVTQSASGTTVAQKATANTYADDTSRWFLGRLTLSSISFARPGQTTRTRSTAYTYDFGTDQVNNTGNNTGLLLSERIQSGVATQDLRTLYFLDSFGNRIAAYQCSNDIDDAVCTTPSSSTQQQSGQTVLRYAKTTYSTNGRYVVGSSVPFYSASATNNWNELQATNVIARDEFGNAVQQHAINDTSATVTQFAKFGVLGRPYFVGDSSGHATTATYRLCGSGATCPANMVFRSQTVNVGAPSSWSYYDLLGRPVMQIAQSFDSNGAGKLFTAACSFFDSHNRPAYKFEPIFVTVTAAADGSPNLTSASPCDSMPHSTSIQYDVLGRPTKVTNPDGGTVETVYVGLNTFATNPRGKTFETIKDELGEVTQTNDPDQAAGGDTTTNLTVTRTFDATGNLIKISRDAGHGPVTSTFVYDDLGRKLSQLDTDSGAASFTYNGAGDLVTQVTQTGALSQTITLSYDAMGRKWQRTTSGAHDGNDLTDTWTYDTATNGYGQLGIENHSGTAATSMSRVYSYDALGRMYQRTTTIGATPYVETTAYDSLGRPRQQQDATGHITLLHYTAHGFVDAQTDTHTDGPVSTINSDANATTQHILYELLGTNERGQPTSERRGGTANLVTTLGYDANTGRLTQVCSGVNCGLQDHAYGYDLAGNLTTRVRNYSGTKNPAEMFTYDALNRLTQTQLGTLSGTVASGSLVTIQATQTQTYDSLGNLCTQAATFAPGAGTNTSQTYTYAGPAGCANYGTIGSAAAVTAISGTANSTYTYDADGNQLKRSSDGRTLTYNVLNQIAKATLGSSVTTFEYGPDGDRFVRDDNGTYTYYVGRVEIQKTNGTVNEQHRYLGVAIDLIVANSTRYTFGDHLGSVDTIADKTGTRLEGGSFDAWGNRRNPDTWKSAGNTAPLSTTTHGFTGHEHVDTFGFIHMNGRIYDPQLGKMLQADPMSNPGSQGLNRYSYVANNPLTLTDPTGYNWLHNLDRIAGQITFGPFFGGVQRDYYAFLANPYVRMVGAIVASYFTFGAASLAFGAIGVTGVAGAMAAGAVAGFVGGAIGSGGDMSAAWQGALGGAVFGAIGARFGSGFSTGKIIASGIAGGVLSTLQGGSFGSGFVSAGLTAALTPTYDKIDNVAARYAVAALVGGTASALVGGKFANGAVTAAFSYALGSIASKVANRDAMEARIEAWAEQSQDLTYAVAFEWPALPQSAVDFAAGWGDTVSMHTSSYIRSLYGIDGGVDEGGDAYRYGGYAGVANSVGSLAGLFKGAVILSDTVVVTRWGGEGAWYMVGGQSTSSWWLSGTRFMYSYDSAVTTEVSASELSYPSGWEWVKGLWGQRVMGP